MSTYQELSLESIDQLLETVQSNVDHFQNTLSRERMDLEENQDLTEEEREEKEDLIKEMNFAKTQTSTILKKIAQAREEYVRTDGNIRQEYVTLFEQFGLMAGNKMKHERITHDQSFDELESQLEKDELVEKSEPRDDDDHQEQSLQHNNDDDHVLSNYSLKSDDVDMYGDQMDGDICDNGSPRGPRTPDSSPMTPGYMNDGSMLEQADENTSRHKPQQQPHQHRYESYPSQLNDSHHSTPSSPANPKEHDSESEDMEQEDNEDYELTEQLKKHQRDQQRRENRNVFDELDAILEGSTTTAHSNHPSPHDSNASMYRPTEMSSMISSTHHSVDYEFSKQKMKELESVKEERNKIRKIAESLVVHIENLQRTNQNLKQNQQDAFEEQIERSQRYMEAIETMVEKDNALLKSHIEQLKREMQMRKTVFNEEMLRLKKLVVETLEKDADEENVIEFSEMENAAMQNAFQTLVSLNEFAHPAPPNNLQDTWYQPIDPSDDLDCAVHEVLRSLNCPVKIEIERVRPGEYYIDKVVQARFLNGQVALKNNVTGHERLSDYIKKLYYPFYQVQNYLETGTETVVVPEEYDSYPDHVSSSDYDSSFSYRSETSISSHRGPIVPLDNQTHPKVKKEVKSVSPARSLSAPRTNRSSSPSVNRSTVNVRSSSPQNARAASPRSSTDSQMRYTSILKSAMEKKKLTSVKPPPEPKKAAVNSSVNSRHFSPRRVQGLGKEEPQRTRSPLREQYEQRQRAKQMTMHQQQQQPQLQQQHEAPVGGGESEYREFDNVRKVSKSGGSSSNRSTSSSSSMLDGIDLNDQAKLRQLHKMALKKQIAQMSSRK